MNIINKASFFLFVCLLLLFTSVEAGDVSKEKAFKVADNFFSRELKINSDNFAMNYQAIKCADNLQKTAMHVFIGTKSYIIIAANDRIFPIIAYSTESTFPAKGEVENLDWWLNNTSNAIAVESKLKSNVSSEITDAWSFYTSNTKSGSFRKNSKGVMPFLQTNWNQDAGYNYYCPSHQAGPDGKCYAGCVATAMAQVMRYYKFPAIGKNTYSYYHQAFGNMNVDFSQSVYNWSKMGNTTSGTDIDTIRRNAIAKLIYDCGISVDMYYTPSGSSSYLFKTQTALYDYFKYKRYIAYADRANYTDDVWRNMMIENLDMKYPLLYGGQDATAGGHAWVCDGYQSNNYFHFNWGWSGMGNGFFYLNNIHSGNGDFNFGQDMVYNIVPDTSVYPLCNDSKKYTSQTYTFQDGSFTDNYENNTNCQWLIKPDTGVSIKLNFLNFNTESGNDILTVYDGESTFDSVLGTYSGNYSISNLPAPLYSTSGSMLLVFITNSTVTNLGWKVKYTTDNVGIAENDIAKQLRVFPNPAKQQLNISGYFMGNGNLKFKIFNSIGSVVLTSDRLVNEGLHTESIDISTLNPGIYLLNAESDKGNYNTKFIVE